MEKNILRLFLYNRQMKFNEIEKQTKERSNKLAYHLQKLTKSGVLTKSKDFYTLSEKSEEKIPYLTEKKSLVPVIIIAIKKEGKIFLVKREKRPFKNKLALPGGRIVLGENIPKATERIMNEKFGIKCKFEKINSISLEMVKNKKEVVHSFILILVTAKTKDKLNYFDLNKSKRSVISSDYYLIKNDLDKETKLQNLITKS
ncbi:MAG: NUDIX domain-containing protein [Nanoarchaeota archaeon]